MSGPSPRIADLIRKAAAGFLAITVTFLLFQQMFLLSSGRFSLTDWRLWAALVMLGLGILWVKAARRVSPPP